MPRYVEKTVDNFIANFNKTSGVLTFEETLRSALLIGGIYMLLSIGKGFFLFCPEGKTKIRAMDNINTIFSRAAEKTGIESASQRNGRRSTVNIAIGICWTRENSVKGSVGSSIWCIALPVIAISANAFRFISKIAMKSKFGEIYFARMSKVPKHT